MNKKKQRGLFLLLVFLLFATLGIEHVNPTNAATVIPSASPTPMPSPQVQIANPDNNGLFWIYQDETYRSGTELYFYATGDGYGPEEPQELDPVCNSTRYIPVNWSVNIQRVADSNTTKKSSGAWQIFSEQTFGHTDSGGYIPGEYRFKSSFYLETAMIIPVPYTLTVKYGRQTYDGESWKNDGEISYKSVSFYIKNTQSSPAYPEFSIPNNSKIEVGDKTDLKVSGVLSKISFTSSNKKVAKIGKSSGEITALSAGETIITAKAPAFGQYGAFQKSITLKVIPKAFVIKSAKSTKKGQIRIIGDSGVFGNTGYRIQYKYPEKAPVTINFKSKKSLHYTIKKLRSGRECYVRAYAYKKVRKKTYSGYYSPWMKAGKVK